MEPRPPTDGHVADQLQSETRAFRRTARRLRTATGSAAGATLIAVFVIAWVALGAATAFPRWWELLVSAGVPLITLLLVVLLQDAQNHDSLATQLKLDELIRATRGASNRMMNVEDSSREDLDRIQEDFRTQAESAAPEGVRHPSPATAEPAER